MWLVIIIILKKNDVSGEPICKPIRIFYLNGLEKYYRKTWKYSIDLERIKDIVKGIKWNFIEQNC